ncbi:hypothetical protein KXQ82_12980 [Mucilaginibacter sp. HMF5004]|uniref:hypothetical protein n=1 Tax=Mucilaginibacter rivuli TaxID=2857527 RepID=UPI001C606D20|nr:hypothetical protein [Mucilaginibacter rivuli]MBW4890642.1 hypothetical protein [Mucilaginibacter rivuli]
MDVTQFQLEAVKDVIDAQQKVITAWEEVFSSVESTVVGLVKINIELKLVIIRQQDPDFVLPQNLYSEMDNLRASYQNGSVSPLEYFQGLDAILNQIVI